VQVSACSRAVCKNRHLAAPMLSLQNGLICMRQLTKAERVGGAHSGGTVRRKA
jgi:hypothetical protein